MDPGTGRERLPGLEEQSVNGRHRGRLCTVPMREDCCHYESRTYDDGEVARFCTLDLAPEAPWRCPEACPRYERIMIVAADFEKGSLAHTPPVEEEPGGPVDDIVEVLADAESIVDHAVPEVVAEIDRERTPWWRRRRRRRRPGDGDDGEDFRLSRR